MTTEKPLSIILSQEELIFLLRIMGTSGILGMGPQSLQGLDSEQINLLMGSAERSLIARQLLSLTSEDSLAIDRVVLALLGPCVIPEKSIIVTLWEFGKEPQAIYYNRSGEMLIEHLYLGDGLHQFAAWTDSNMMLDRLADHLQITGQGQAMRETSVLTMLEFQRVVELIRDDKSLEADFRDAKNLGRLMKSGIEHAEINANIVVFDHLSDENNLEIEALSLLLGSQSIWRLEYLEYEESEEGIEQILISASSSINARNMLKRLFQL